MSRPAAASEYEPAVRSNALLCHPADVGGCVEGLRRDICAIRPADGRAGYEEVTKIPLIAERLEDWPVKPGLKVHRLRGSIVEDEMDAVVAAVLGLNDSWENRHVTPLLFQRRNLPKRLAE